MTIKEHNILRTKETSLKKKKKKKKVITNKKLLYEKDTTVMIHLENAAITYRAVMRSWGLWCNALLANTYCFADENTLHDVKGNSFLLVLVINRTIILLNTIKERKKEENKIINCYMLYIVSSYIQVTTN